MAITRTAEIRAQAAQALEDAKAAEAVAWRAYLDARTIFEAAQSAWEIAEAKTSMARPRP